MNIGLIGLTSRYALGAGFHVIIEGILYADRYAAMLDALRRDHRGPSCFYYLDVPLAETLRRHAARPQAAEFGPANMARWYRERDLLPGGIEHVIPATWTLDEVVGQVMADAGLAAQPPQPAPPPRARRSRCPSDIDSPRSSLARGWLVEARSASGDSGQRHARERGQDMVTQFGGIKIRGAGRFVPASRRRTRRPPARW